MPVTDVYQMPLGRATCLPRGCVPASVGSQTDTTNSCGPVGFNCSVISKSSRRISAAMLAHLLAVHEHGRIPIDGAKVQQGSLVFPCRWPFEAGAIPKPVGVAHFCHHAGKGRFNRKRHQDFAVEFLRPRFVLRPHGVIPKSIQVLPLTSNHLRPRVFCQSILRRNFGGPPRRQRSFRRLPSIIGKGDRGNDHRADHYICTPSHDIPRIMN